MAFGLVASPALALDPDLAAVNRTAFEAVDANDDGIVSFDEYMGWRAVAELRGKVAVLREARTAVFAFWDKDGDGLLLPAEQMMSQTVDFYAPMMAERNRSIARRSLAACASSRQ